MSNIQNVLFELALFINNQLYEENQISIQMYEYTKKELLSKLERSKNWTYTK